MVAAFAELALIWNFLSSNKKIREDISERYGEIRIYR